MVEAKLVDLKREHNCLDVELEEFEKKLFEQASAKQKCSLEKA